MLLWEAVHSLQRPRHTPRRHLARKVGRLTSPTRTNCGFAATRSTLDTVTWRERFDALDRRVIKFMTTYGVVLLRWSIGLIFIWFGALKLFPGLSPADQIATDTTEALTLGLLPPDLARLGLAILEITIGIGLIIRKYLRLTLALLFAQMAGTLTPLLIFPERIWSEFPFVLTLEGQYIMKNGVLISAGLVIGATVKSEKETAPVP